jgi:hypothetical protein
MSRAEAVLALIDAKAELDRAKQNVPDYTGWRQAPYYDEQRAYDAAVAEYEAAHAPTADEIMDLLVSHLDTDVKVTFEHGQVSVEVGLRWYDNSKNHNQRFGHDHDDDHDNQCIGETP